MEQVLIKEAIDVLKENKRPELIDVTIYGRYTSKKHTYLYNDAERAYERHAIRPETKEVRSVKAFATIIKEELRRRENESGEKATVKINLSGGYFIPDDDFGEETIKFSRLTSQQWNLVRNGINKVYNHREFLQFLQALAPSINDFQDMFKRFSLLRLVGKSTLTSNPIITADGQSEGYTCTYKLDDGCDGEEHFPTGFWLDVPFAKAGEKTYEIPIELLFFRNNDDELRIEVLCPLFENIEEQAIIDEADFVKSTLQNCESLLILSDF